jgi:DNA repair protein SbcC/Rad50
MIIERIHLKSFAGISNKVLSLTKGMNVVSGPNEAGKSTLAKALSFVFFVTTKLTPAKERELIKNCLPVSGGDTLSVSIEFVEDGKKYTLSKSWGGTKSSRLESSSGELLTDPDAVQSKLMQLLGLNEATWMKILFVHQACLGQTVELIGSVREISNTLTDLLRGAVLASGGVSADELKEQLEANISEYYSNWDEIAKRPRDGRGIENEWKKNRGKILEAHYEWKRTEERLAEREKYDRQIDELAQRLNGLTESIKELGQYISTNEVFVNDARRRSTLEREIEILKLKLQKFKEDSVRWPTIEASEKNNSVTIGEKESEVAKLKEEITVAEKKEKGGSKIEKFNKYQALKKELEELEENLKNLKKVLPKDHDAARNHTRLLNDIRIKLNAQQLRISLLVKKDFASKISRGVEAPFDQDFKAGDQENFDAPGKFKIETDSLELSLTSGNEDIESLTQQFNDAEKKIKEIFNQYDVTDLAGLDLLANKEKEKSLEINQKKQAINIILGDDKIENLTSEIESLSKLPSVRELTTLRDEYLNKTSTLALLKQKAELEKQELKGLAQSYESPEKLNDLLLDSNTDLRAKNKELEKLSILPHHVESAEDFVNEFENARGTFLQRKEELTSLMLEKAELEKNEPEFSLIDLRSDLNLFQKHFSNCLEEGEAYKKILLKLNSILENEASAAFNPYYEKAKRYFALLTNGRYQNISMENIMPKNISNGTSELSIDLLSAGTNDSLALALHLSMADFYLANRDGFIVLDDPLTEMDPDRQKAGATCLKEFAQTKQVLTFTCHPSTETLLGGNIVKLN